MDAINIDALIQEFGVPEELAADFEGIVNAQLLSITRHIDDSILHPKGLTNRCQDGSTKKIMLDDDDLKRIQKVSSQNMPFHLTTAPVPAKADRQKMVELYGDLSIKGKQALFGEVCYKALKDDYTFLNTEELFGVERLCSQDFKQELRRELGVTKHDEEAFGSMMLALQSAAFNAFDLERTPLGIPDKPKGSQPLTNDFEKVVLGVEDAEQIYIMFCNRADKYMKSKHFGGGVDERSTLYESISNTQRMAVFNACMPAVTKDYCEQPVPRV